MSPSGWSQWWDSNPHCRTVEARLSGLGRLRKPVPPHWAWSARGDSNPDLHGLNVPRLPIAPRADGEHVIPPGGLEPPPRGLRARYAALTLQRGLERMAGFEPAPQGLEGRRATVTPHSLWFGLRESNPSLRAGNAGCSLHTQAERGPVSFTGPSTIRRLSKNPLLRAGSGRIGDSARIRTWTRESWRLRCSVTPRCRATTLSEDKTSP